jgi:8-oxo-dGTP pyrophosphatase MutT (NUDIX family)
MLDLDPTRDGVAPRDAATLVLLRDTPARTVEVFCVERNKKSRFLGGAIVFPGGRVEDADRDDAWSALVNDTTDTRHLGVAACRETLEEAALLLADAPVSDTDVLALRARLTTDATSLRTFLTERSLKLDLRALAPLSRWITPKVEARRFDARFFVARAPEGQQGAHDMTETMASFWDTPSNILQRFDRAEIQLAPPTHRTLQILAECTNVEAALSRARASSLAPICPELVQQADTMALVLPGDPQHSIQEARIAGPSRYVLRGEHWRAESLP